GAVTGPVDRPGHVQRVEAGGGIAAGPAIAACMRVACRRSRIDAGTIDGKTATGNTPTGSTAVPNGRRAELPAAKPADLTRIGACTITVIPEVVVVIDDRDIVDHRSAVDDRDIVRLAHIVVVDLRTGDILVRYEAPIMRRRVIAAAISHAHGDAGLHRRPAIVIVAVPPADPGRGP